MAERGAGSVLSQDRSPPGGCALEAGGRRRRLPSRERLCFLSLFLFVVVCSSSFFHCVVSFVGMRRTPQGRLANSSQQQSTRSQLHSGGNGLRCCCCSLERLISTTPRTHSLGPYRRCAAGRRSCNLGWRVPARGPFDRPRPKAARLPTFNLPRADAGGRICCAAAFGFGGQAFVAESTGRSDAVQARGGRGELLGRRRPAGSPGQCSPNLSGLWRPAIDWIRPLAARWWAAVGGGGGAAAARRRGKVREQPFVRTGGHGLGGVTRRGHAAGPACVARAFRAQHTLPTSPSPPSPRPRAERQHFEGR